MAFIWDKFNEKLTETVQSDKIWKHLETMYNLEALDESESLPFPNDECEFCLPESEYGALKVKKEEKNEEIKNTQKGRETPKIVKEPKKEEKQINKNTKETPRRDSKDSKDGKSTPIAKKELKKEPEREKSKSVKSRSSVSAVKDETKSNHRTPQKEETPRSEKRLTRGSQKIDDSGSNGKASPVTVTPNSNKRRRL